MKEEKRNLPSGHQGGETPGEGSCDAARELFCRIDILQCLCYQDDTQLLILVYNETHRANRREDGHRRRDLTALLAQSLKSGVGIMP